MRKVLLTLTAASAIVAAASVVPASAMTGGDTGDPVRNVSRVVSNLRVKLADALRRRVLALLPSSAPKKKARKRARS